MVQRRRATTAELVPDSDIERVHANANFGALSKRAVVDEGVLKYAFGFDTGHTQMQILMEHGLISIRHVAHRPMLTAKGKNYLRALGSRVLAAFGTAA